MKFIRKIYDWMGEKVHSPYALCWLGGLFFLEASCFFLPVDPLLVLFCVQDRKRSFFYGTFATVCSVLGGLFGYAIGFFLWSSIGLFIVSNIISQLLFDQAVEKYKMYEMWAVLIGGLTPVPYKAVTISAGFCKLPIIPFTLYSLLARGIRFIGIAWLIHHWGAQIQYFIDRYFNHLVGLFTMLLFLGFLALRW